MRNKPCNFFTIFCEKKIEGIGMGIRLTSIIKKHLLSFIYKGIQN